MEIAGEMEIDILHRHHLGVSATRGPTLNAEHRPQAGLANAKHRVVLQLAERLGDPDGDGRLAFAGGGGIDASDQNQPAPSASATQCLQANLGFVRAVEAPARRV